MPFITCGLKINSDEYLCKTEIIATPFLNSKNFITGANQPVDTTTGLKMY